MSQCLQVPRSAAAICAAPCCSRRYSLVTTDPASQMLPTAHARATRADPNRRNLDLGIRRLPAPLVPRRWAPRCASCCRMAARSPALTPAAAHQVHLNPNPRSPAHCQAGGTCQACQRYHHGLHSTSAAGMAAFSQPISVAMHPPVVSQRASLLVERLVHALRQIRGCHQ